MVIFFISLNERENNNNVPCPRSWHSMLKINEKSIFIYGGLSQNSYALGNKSALSQSLTKIEKDLNIL